MSVFSKTLKYANFGADMEKETNTQSAEQPKNANGSLYRKIRIIRFVTLSTVLFIISDTIGRWFLPADVPVSGFYRALIWVLCLLNGAVLFYGWRRLTTPWLKWTAAAAYCILFIWLLSVCGFYRSGGPGLIGYRFSVSIVPVTGLLIVAATKEFIRWYGNLIKRVFHLDSINSAVFMLFMILPVALTVMLFIGSYRLAGSLARMGADINQYLTEGEINHNRDHREPVRQYDRLFNDLNDVQLEAARKNGLKNPITTDEATTDRHLQKIEPNRYYDIEKLTHSVPYLVPRAAHLLEDMGKAFQDSLFNRGYNRNHRFTVTSVLRTQETVRQLRRTNVNSTENSCHCYGTTFDISYFTYDTPAVGKVATVDKMRQILYQVAYDMKRQNRCYVKYEKQQTCLHITVR